MVLSRNSQPYCLVWLDAPWVSQRCFYSSLCTRRFRTPNPRSQRNQRMYFGEVDEPEIFGIFLAFWNAYPGHHWLSSICFCIIFVWQDTFHLHSLGPKVDSDQCSTSASDTSLSESKSKSVIFRWPIPMILAMRFASGFATFAMYEAVPLWLISDSAVGGLSLDEKSVGSLLCRSGILKSWQVLEGLDQNGPITDKNFYEHKSMDVSGKDAEICLHLSLRYLEHLLLHLDFAPLHQAFWYSLLFRGNKHHRSSHCNPSSLLQLQFGLVTKDCPRAIFAWNLYEFIIYLVWICRIWGCMNYCDITTTVLEVNVPVLAKCVENCSVKEVLHWHFVCVGPKALLWQMSCISFAHPLWFLGDVESNFHHPVLLVAASRVQCWFALHLAHMFFHGWFGQFGQDWSKFDFD